MNGNKAVTEYQRIEVRQVREDAYFEPYKPVLWF